MGGLIIPDFRRERGGIGGRRRCGGKALQIKGYTRDHEASHELSMAGYEPQGMTFSAHSLNINAEVLIRNDLSLHEILMRIVCRACLQTTERL